MRYRIMELEQKKKQSPVPTKNTTGTAPVERGVTSPLQARLLSAQAGFGNRYVQRMVACWKEEQDAGEAIQFEAEGTQGEERVNRTGLPDPLKLGIEQLSGYSLDAVRVHYNSSKPAELQALAYTQGTDIYVAPGQERHLPHEAWHVVQQAQNRVRPTAQLNGGVPVNHDGGLEREADLMGRKAAPAGNHGEHGQEAHTGNSAQQVGIIQMETIYKEIGQTLPPGITDEEQVQRDFDQDIKYNWPAEASGLDFHSLTYGESVNLAMKWGAKGGEGTSGWHFREYKPREFDGRAKAAGDCSQQLINPLKNEANETLIAVRTFRSSNEGMAHQTLQDLISVLQTVTKVRAGLAGAGMIGNAAETVTDVKSEPAEAHPNTLPTAKITFSGGEKLYFKGRSGSVEDALVGTNQSAAQEISKLGSLDPKYQVGTHPFVSGEFTHLSQDVSTGARVPEGYIPSLEEAIQAWVSAARTAALVSLTGTSDLHESNVIDVAKATKFIIDAEFLLDATTWGNYETAFLRNETPNFDMNSMAPRWVIDFTRSLPRRDKELLSVEVAHRFRELDLNNHDTLDRILAPIRRIIDQFVLLRIAPMPFETAFWLNVITEYNNNPDSDEVLDRTWNRLNEEYPRTYHIDLANKDRVIRTLRTNFRNGMVPLFHVETRSGNFYLNKDTLIGQVREDRSPSTFLVYTKTAMINSYENMIQKVKDTINNIRGPA